MHSCSSYGQGERGNDAGSRQSSIDKEGTEGALQAAVNDTAGGEAGEVMCAT